MKIKRLVFVISMSVCAFLLTGCVVVDDGTVGISKSFGNINKDVLTPGIYPSIPVIREIEVWNIKTQRRSLNLDIPSAEGLIVKLQSTVLFRPKEVIRLRTEVGPDFVQTVLDSTLINTFREVIGKQKVEEIITNQAHLTGIAEENLRAELNVRGITIEDLMITGLELPTTFKDAIERKLEQEQKALQKSFELDQAKKDAEIEVARARGAAEAQEIVRATLSAEYLQYLWISTLNENPNVIYVSTEANMPMFRTTSDARKSKNKSRAMAPRSIAPQKK